MTRPDVRARAGPCEAAVLHWLVNERQRRFPCSVPLVLRARLHIFPMKNQPFFPKRPILALKRNVKRSCWSRLHTFPMKKSTFLMKLSQQRTLTEGVLHS